MYNGSIGVRSRLEILRSFMLATDQGSSKYHTSSSYIRDDLKRHQGMRLCTLPTHNLREYD